MFDGDDADDLVPVPPAPHFPNTPPVDELHGLVMNIVVPPSPPAGASAYPVMVYVHGGSLLYGGANLPIFDGVKFVSHSIDIGSPIVYVNFNYRVGLGGFLASQAIKDELARDGHTGCGNFGFTDQKVAFDWVQRYISLLGGDASRVTAVGESAGGISISNHLSAANPPRFHRAVCMSGLSVSIPPWTMQQHQELYDAVCRHFGIDHKSEHALDELRHVPQQKLANATAAIQGVASGTGNPCLDGWFYASNPLEIQEPPEWLDAFMLGDTYHEGVIFHLNLLEDDFTSVKDTLQAHIKNEKETIFILDRYGITPTLGQDEFIHRVEHMCGDAVFKAPNYLTATAYGRLDERNALFKYHFDQRSRLKNAFEGTAYHAHELLYLFGNLDNEMNQDEKTMACEFAASWIRFVNEKAPWKAPRGSWMIWGLEGRWSAKTEEEDEETRSYRRMREMAELGDGETWKKWLAGVDALVNKRMNMGRGDVLMNGY